MSVYLPSWLLGCLFGYCVISICMYVYFLDIIVFPFSVSPQFCHCKVHKQYCYLKIKQNNKKNIIQNVNNNNDNYNYSSINSSINNISEKKNNNQNKKNIIVEILQYKYSYNNNILYFFNFLYFGFYFFFFCEILFLFYFGTNLWHYKHTLKQFSTTVTLTWIYQT